ncbi:hypothetical protein SKAU_G00043620 [Synaphobranchus kaupii]|uniref:Uncharacterized protein n=1 Tax=Synaphobranchus kaupii TaxID=118154 RepID=A0A9Q1G2J6_SYNKA|nr:hypothetical protein SKAU_G00043620 [Synaphobranchus kaupii]
MVSELPEPQRESFMGGGSSIRACATKGADSRARTTERDTARHGVPAARRRTLFVNTVLLDVAGDCGKKEAQRLRRAEFSPLRRLRETKPRRFTGPRDGHRATLSCNGSQRRRLIGLAHTSLPQAGPTLLQAVPYDAVLRPRRGSRARWRGSSSASTAPFPNGDASPNVPPTRFAAFSRLRFPEHVLQWDLIIAYMKPPSYSSPDPLIILALWSRGIRTGNGLPFGFPRYSAPYP